MLDQKIVKQIGEIIENNQKFLFQFHLGPDPDSVGSALAFALVLKSLGKDAVVSRGDSPLPDFLNIMPGKELVVDKSIPEIDLNNFDVLFVLDTASPDRLTEGDVSFPDTLKTVVIDHHITNPLFGQVNLVPEGYPATGQILYELFTELGLAIPPGAAGNLFLGMYTDTGGFRYRGTTSTTLTAAAKLVEIYPDFPDLLFGLMNNNEPESLLFEKLLLESLEIVGGGKVAVVGASHKDLEDNGITANHIHGGLSNKLISVKDWEVGVTILEVEPGLVKFSFRTRDENKFDVAKIAAALGGGGHKSAAGAKITSSYSGARDQLIKALGETYKELS